MDPKLIGNLIKQFREKRKLTQQNLADNLNVSSKTISK
jgi:DNA-binding XRE family transcriptional regulator